MISFYFTVGGWRMYPFNLPLLATAYTPTQSYKRASLLSLSPPQAEITNPNPLGARHL